MVGLGAQEILILAVCCALPLVGASVVLVLVVSQKKKARPRSGDRDEPDDDR